MGAIQSMPQNPKVRRSKLFHKAAMVTITTCEGQQSAFRKPFWRCERPVVSAGHLLATRAGCQQGRRIASDLSRESAVRPDYVYGEEPLAMHRNNRLTRRCAAVPKSYSPAEPVILGAERSTAA
jgi:hypothetical protein